MYLSIFLYPHNTNTSPKRLYQWFSGKILACHASAPGSIPGWYNSFLHFWVQCIIWYQITVTLFCVFVSFLVTTVLFLCLQNDDLRHKRLYQWFSGKILACHASAPGSIPGWYNVFLFFVWSPCTFVGRSILPSFLPFYFYKLFGSHIMYKNRHLQLFCSHFYSFILVVWKEVVGRGSGWIFIYCCCVTLPE